MSRTGVQVHGLRLSMAVPSQRHGDGMDASPERGSPPHALIALFPANVWCKAVRVPNAQCPSTSRTLPISASAENGFSRNAAPLSAIVGSKVA